MSQIHTLFRLGLNLLETEEEENGIVFQDYIERDLHPIKQIDLCQKLKAIYPNVQFIVSTDSPFVLLGAPSDSVFIKCKRVKDFIELEKLDIDISNLTLNTIASSPLFDVEKLIHIDNKKFSLDLKKTKEFFSEVLDCLQGKATEVLGKLLVKKKLKEIKNES